MQISNLEQEMIDKALAAHGSIKLDLSDRTHLLFLMERLGGEDRLRRNAPDLYRKIQDPRPASVDTASSMLHLRSYHRVESPSVNVPDEQAQKSHPMATIACTLRSAAAVDGICATSSQFRAYDMDMKKVVCHDFYDLQPSENGEFSLPVDLSMSMEQSNLGHTYLLSSLFYETLNQADGDAAFQGTFSVSSFTTVNISEKLKKITLSHPIIRHGNDRSNLKDSVCISYERQAQLESPDYSYDVSIQGNLDHIPVHLPFHLCVELTGDASFEAINGSYFDGNSDPQISVMNLKSPDMTPISDGESAFLAKWDDFSRDYVSVEVNPQTGLADKLYIRFASEDVPEARKGGHDLLSGNRGDLWPADLEYPIPGEFWNVSAYASFYAHISFNITYGKIHGSLPIILMYQKGMPVSYETAAGKNTMYIPDLYYQWGCLAEDTFLYKDKEKVMAQDVRIGDRLLTRDGTYRRVRDIITGPSQTILAFTLSGGASVRLTADHTLCLADGEPLAASNVRTGDLLQIWQWEEGTTGTDEVIRIQTLPYEGTVYNFAFEEPTFPVAQGIIVGDHHWQQQMRPFHPQPYRLPEPNGAARLLLSQLGRLKDGSEVPAFVESDAPDIALFYYCSLKAMMMQSGLYEEAEAQEIASFAAFLESNATYGGFPVEEVPPELASRDLTIPGGSCIYLKLIPTAMEKWYQDLSASLTWTAPTSPAGQEKRSFCFRPKEDILVPFHYPVAPGPSGQEEDPALVQYHPAFLDGMLSQILEKAKGGALSGTALSMGIGTVLHLLIDTKMHENYSGLGSWQNLRRVQHAYNHERRHVENHVYREHPYEKFTSNDNCPAGIEQSGSCADTPFALYDYIFPLDNGALIDPGLYYGYKTVVKSAELCAALQDAMRFLFQYKGKKLDDLDWQSRYQPLLKKAMETSYNRQETDKDRRKEACLKIWKDVFSFVTFDHDPGALYQALTTGKDGNYDDLFRYVLMLDRIQKGDDLYD